MKILLLTFLVLLSISYSNAQVRVDGVDVNQLDEVKYVSIIGYNKSLFGQKIVITIDYGQKYSFMKAQTIEGHFKNGKERSMEFNSMIDALNFMEANGWEYVNNTEYTNGNSNVSHYLLKRSD